MDPIEDKYCLILKVKKNPTDPKDLWLICMNNQKIA